MSERKTQLSVELTLYQKIQDVILAKLANEDFMNKAKPFVIEKEKKKLQEVQDKIDSLLTLISQLQ